LASRTEPQGCQKSNHFGILAAFDVFRVVTGNSRLPRSSPVATLPECQNPI
jgi:hypothetical protein